VRPWPERPPWRAHRQLNDCGNPELFEGIRSLDISLHAATTKPRMGGKEGGAHRRSGRAAEEDGVDEETLLH
jgi:hypothetical protein